MPGPRTTGCCRYYSRYYAPIRRCQGLTLATNNASTKGGRLRGSLTDAPEAERGIGPNRCAGSSPRPSSTLRWRHCKGPDFIVTGRAASSPRAKLSDSRERKQQIEDDHSQTQPLVARLNNVADQGRQHQDLRHLCPESRVSVRCMEEAGVVPHPKLQLPNQPHITITRAIQS